MNDKNYLAMAVATAKRKKLAHTTPQEYALPIWMMFIAADILENSAMEIQELLMQDEQFIQSDKMHIKAIINHAGKFVRDVDRTCEYQFACKFADYTEECSTLLRSYMQNKLAKMDNIWARRNDHVYRNGFKRQDHHSGYLTGRSCHPR